MSYSHGQKGEDFFRSLLNQKGIDYSFINDWYDFLVNDAKVEVKSCKISIKNNGTRKKTREYGYSIGRFDFTSKENREKQFQENIWVCFIVRHYNQFILLGFLRAERLNKRRYLSIHDIHELKPLLLEDWLEIVNK